MKMVVPPVSRMYVSLAGRRVGAPASVFHNVLMHEALDGLYFHRAIHHHVADPYQTWHTTALTVAGTRMRRGSR